MPLHEPMPVPVLSPLRVYANTNSSLVPLVGLCQWSHFPCEYMPIQCQSRFPLWVYANTMLGSLPSSACTPVFGEVANRTVSSILSPCWVCPKNVSLDFSVFAVSQNNSSWASWGYCLVCPVNASWAVCGFSAVPLKFQLCSLWLYGVPNECQRSIGLTNKSTNGLPIFQSVYTISTQAKAVWYLGAAVAYWFMEVDHRVAFQISPSSSSYLFFYFL